MSEPAAAAAAATASAPKSLQAIRAPLESVLRQRGFIFPSFEIYNGVAGLYDYGPAGCAVKSNLLAFWRKHFVLHESMLEIECTALTPFQVLATSGHVKKFKDVMVTDAKTSENFRADHLLEEFLDKHLEKAAAADRDELQRIRATVGGMNADTIAPLMKRFNIVSPTTGNPLSEPYDFNLMFNTNIGPGSKIPGFLRPELAQGIFVNFKRLIEYNGNKVPFACAQIGQAFRNEIAPRAGVLRVREFTLAEIEHFCDPKNKKHPRFARVAHLSLPLLTADRQEQGASDALPMNLGEAVAKGVINNETLGYFLARTYLFLTACGVKQHWLRFRQHCRDEMAHYASDCWDAEIYTSYGWVECVGHADRSCFDLEAHGEAMDVDLVAQELYDAPVEVDVVVRNINKKLLGMQFKKQAQELSKYLEKLSYEKAMDMQTRLDAGSVDVHVGTQTFTVTREMVTFVAEKQKVHTRTFVPNVVEPSFGVGRILYCVLEHVYTVREDDEQRVVLAFPPVIAPVKATVLPLSGRDEYEPIIDALDTQLTEHGVSHKVDTSGASIGRRYARADELGIPFAITIDECTVTAAHPKFGTVTLRERDSAGQVEGKIEDIVAIVAALSEGRKTWEQVQQTFAAVTKKEDRQV